MKNVAWQTFILIWQKKILFAVHVFFLYYKVKSVVMAKQIVINFLKTCINMYIVLLDPVWSNPKTGPNEAWDHMACRLLCEVESVGITGDF